MILNLPRGVLNGREREKNTFAMSFDYPLGTTTLSPTTFNITALRLSEKDTQYNKK
jgi:hypothetical protein